MRLDRLASNTLNTSVDTLTATATTGGMFVRDLNDITLTSINGATGQDVIVVAPGDITVAQITPGTGGAGRVLLSAGSDILASGAGDHITASNVELRAGGLDPDGGPSARKTQLRLIVPPTIGGGANGTGASVAQRPDAAASGCRRYDRGVRRTPSSGCRSVRGGAGSAPGNQNVDDYLTTVSPCGPHRRTAPWGWPMPTCSSAAAPS